MSTNEDIDVYTDVSEMITSDIDDSYDIDGDGDGDVEGDGDGDGYGYGDGDVDVDGDEDGDRDRDREGQDEEVSGVDVENVSDGGSGEWCIENGIIVDCLADIVKINMKNIREEEVCRYDFADLAVAYLFYSWYARVNGFVPRKDRILRNKEGDIVQQTFVCSREGYRDGRRVLEEERLREEKNETRCGCEAKFRVYIEMHSRRWYVTIFNDEHNHDLLPSTYCGLLPTHRKLTDADILQIENFRRAGIRPCHMYGSFANNSGGYHRIRFMLKDIHNQLGRQRRELVSDACSALKFLQKLRASDPLMFVRHTVDDNGSLQRLFWSDGESQMNYKIFGDVLAFDATYKKNKYMCPFVVFSGVNHHNQTIVFGSALVWNETEETYVWLLERFMEVMQQKAPSSVITDGCQSMRNAIKRVFPHAHHRLCAWHLLRNASSNVVNPECLQFLKKCVFSDYDVSEFEETWDEIVTSLGLQENSWLTDLYSRRKMWATSHIRGNFFAGIRMTSRCEALHSHIKKYVHSKISLTEFVEQFHRCLTYFHFKEVEADFKSEYGDIVLQTNLQSIERSTSRKFTKEIFKLFRKVLFKVTRVRVVECHEMSMFNIYSVSKYCGRGNCWNVTFCPSPMEFRCSGLRMESTGIPCEHIVVVMVSLDFTVLPDSLVMNRWSKRAKESIKGTYVDCSFYWDSHVVARYANLTHICTQLSEFASRDEEDYNDIVDVLTDKLNKLKLKYSTEGVVQNSDAEGMCNTIQDPPIVRTKGCGSTTVDSAGRLKRIQRCSSCGQHGHNRRSCPTGSQNNEVGDGTCDYSMEVDDTVVPECDDNINSCMEQAETLMPTSYPLNED